ncbi:MAG: uroporphyrinogen-III C-methyltransferase [Candidatus Zixiibacteriota bacterium]
MSSSWHNTGTVYLVGAGPGDPDLITVKGTQLLRSCDVVVYDNLVPDELLVGLPSSVERIYVGKMVSDHSLPQDEINRLLVVLASQGKTVVRLKGGDPFVFGRGGEEAQYLAEQGVPFEIVPGVTAGIGGPALAGIPVTDRRYASSVTLLTGHGSDNDKCTSVALEALAAVSGTLVIYMGVAELEQNVARLLESGMSPDTPSAAIERATLPTQRVITAPLGELPSRTREQNLKPPVLFVVGEVVKLREILYPRRMEPLHGLRVMVCRPADQAEWVYRTLRDLGAEVLAYPTIATEAYHDQATWERIGSLSSSKRWLVFTSENGVRYFMHQWREGALDIRGLGEYKIAAVGFGTARALEEFMLRPDFVPTRATTAELAMQMSKKIDLDGATVVRVRGNLGDERIQRALGQAGATVIPAQVYSTVTHIWPAHLKEKLFAHPPDVIMFTSGSTVDGLVANLTPDELVRLTNGSCVVSIGPSTSDVIGKQGITVSLEAATHSIPDLIDALVSHHKANPIWRAG